MNGLAAGAFIVGAFFAAGVALGVAGIISLSVTRRRRGRDYPQWAARGARPGPPDPDEELLQDSDDYPGSTRPWPRDNGYRS